MKNARKRQVSKKAKNAPAKIQKRIQAD